MLTHHCCCCCCCCRRCPCGASGLYRYDCPGDSLLDVSWHITGNAAPGGVSQFIMEPNLLAVVGVSAEGPGGGGSRGNRDCV